MNGLVDPSNSVLRKTPPWNVVWDELTSPVGQNFDVQNGVQNGVQKLGMRESGDSLSPLYPKPLLTDSGK